MKLVKYIFLDLVRSRFVLSYFFLLLIFTVTFFLLQNDTTKIQLSLLNIILLIIPLVSVVFSTIHWYNSAEFIEVLLAQPVSRSRIFISEFVAVSLALGGAFLIALGVPMIIFSCDAVSVLLALGGFFLTIIFIALAFWSAVFTRDKAKGIGLSLVLWLYFSLLYDGLVLMLMFNFSDYPIEKLVVALLSLNPVDMARVMVLMKMDMSAMLGYSGAVFTEFLGSNAGLIYTIVLLFLWAIAPFFFALRRFSKKDL